LNRFSSFKVILTYGPLIILEPVLNVTAEVAKYGAILLKTSPDAYYPAWFPSKRALAGYSAGSSSEFEDIRKLGLGVDVNVGVTR
jgi:hypothetical protein